MAVSNPKPFSRHSTINQFRYALGTGNTLLPLALIGLLSGIATALVIAAFLGSIETLKVFLMMLLNEGDDSVSLAVSLESAMKNHLRDFEQLSTWSRFLVVAFGAALLGAIFHFLRPEQRATGLNHTLVTLHRDYARFPLANFLVQFFGGILALASGQSGGREGPGIHLGAAISTLLASIFHLPHNSLRILTACGAAAAIGAAFNTPVAGVIFAMEVIVLEYTLVGFVPVIIAAVSATLVSNSVFGHEALFSIAEIQMQSLAEVPLLLVLALCCALASVSFIKVQQWSTPLLKLPVFIRFSLVGLVTAAIGMQFPQVLGMGFDSINDILHGGSLWSLLLLVCLFKIIATALSSAVGMPIGIVGPSLFIGATLGAAFAQISAGLMPMQTSSSQFYILLAMGGVMSALLNAPLAAVVAVMELSGSSDALLPGVLVVVMANLFASQVFRQRSANEILLAGQGIYLDSHPIAQALNRKSLSALGKKSQTIIDSDIASQLNENTLETEEEYLYLLDRERLEYAYLGKNDRQTLLRSYGDSDFSIKQSTKGNSDASLAIAQASALNFETGKLIAIDLACTLEQARQAFRGSDAQALLVSDCAGDFELIVTRRALAQYIDES